jgi:hypothetical protein
MAVVSFRSHSLYPHPPKEEALAVIEYGAQLASELRQTTGVEGVGLGWCSTLTFDL